MAVSWQIFPYSCRIKSSLCDQSIPSGLSVDFNAGHFSLWWVDVSDSVYSVVLP